MQNCMFERVRRVDGGRRESEREREKERERERERDMCMCVTKVTEKLCE